MGAISESAAQPLPSKTQWILNLDVIEDVCRKTRHRLLQIEKTLLHYSQSSKEASSEEISEMHTVTEDYFAYIDVLEAASRLIKEFDELTEDSYLKVMSSARAHSGSITNKPSTSLQNEPANSCRQEKIPIKKEAPSSPNTKKVTKIEPLNSIYVNVDSAVPPQEQRLLRQAPEVKAEFSKTFRIEQNRNGNNIVRLNQGGINNKRFPMKRIVLRSLNEYFRTTGSMSFEYTFYGVVAETGDLALHLRHPKADGSIGMVGFVFRLHGNGRWIDTDGEELEIEIGLEKQAAMTTSACKGGKPTNTENRTSGSYSGSFRSEEARNSTELLKSTATVSRRTEKNRTLPTSNGYSKSSSEESRKSRTNSSSSSDVRRKEHSANAIATSSETRRRKEVHRELTKTKMPSSTSARTPSVPEYIMDLSSKSLSKETRRGTDASHSIIPTSAKIREEVTKTPQKETNRNSVSYPEPSAPTETSRQSPTVPASCSIPVVIGRKISEPIVSPAKHLNSNQRKRGAALIEPAIDEGKPPESEDLGREQKRQTGENEQSTEGNEPPKKKRSSEVGAPTRTATKHPVQVGQKPRGKPDMPGTSESLQKHDEQATILLSASKPQTSPKSHLKGSIPTESSVDRSQPILPTLTLAENRSPPQGASPISPKRCSLSLAGSRISSDSSTSSADSSTYSPASPVRSPSPISTFISDSRPTTAPQSPLPLSIEPLPKNRITLPTSPPQPAHSPPQTLSCALESNSIELLPKNTIIFSHHDLPSSSRESDDNAEYLQVSVHTEATNSCTGPASLRPGGVHVEISASEEEHESIADMPLPSRFRDAKQLPAGAVDVEIENVEIRPKRTMAKKNAARKQRRKEKKSLKRPHLLHSYAVGGENTACTALFSEGSALPCAKKIRIAFDQAVTVMHVFAGVANIAPKVAKMSLDPFPINLETEQRHIKIMASAHVNGNGCAVLALRAGKSSICARIPVKFA